MYKVGTVKTIASVFNADNLRAGIIIAIQRKRYWSWFPFGYYFQLGFVAKNSNRPAFMGWFDGNADGEKRLKDCIATYFPGSRSVPQSELGEMEEVLTSLEGRLQRLRP